MVVLSSAQRQQVVTQAAFSAPMSLRSIVMYVRDLSRATRFYTEGLQLGVSHATSTTAHLALADENPTSIVLQAVDGYVLLRLLLVITHVLRQESMLCTGYSPSLQFTIDEFDTRIYRLLELGGMLDGPIQYKIHGKVCACCWESHAKHRTRHSTRSIKRQLHVLRISHGVWLEGFIFSQIASMRSPDGHMISLYEPAEEQ